ncbi:MAG TPA: bifunctional serine/threonine-protein kinase/universal stress protein, partial [Thermoanaerobaculia bacterium]|nr:bifunctional serine/threonine-protein kinase/universal stress protein [Thermoanaerobaculia bacterium]
PDHPGPLVMKVPTLLEGEDPAAIVSFEMEQMILPRLSGPHVPRFVAAGDFSARPYLVMERIQGSSLFSRLDALPLPYVEVASVGAKVAAALEDIHRQGVLHLDVKPSNVVLRDGTGEAALIDFGLARHEALPDLMEQEFRVPYGTAPYMAPEQILGIRNDSRSDLFALGVLLYFFSTAVRPFGDPSGRRRLHRRLWRDPVPPRRRRPDYPPWLQEVVLRCLEPEAGRRHPTAAQLAFDLANPDAVKLTARAEKLRSDRWTTVVRRRFHPDYRLTVRRLPLAEQLSAGPIVAVAVDLDEASRPLQDALRETVARLREILPDGRFAFVNVLRHHLIAYDTTLEADGRNKHVRRLVELRHWAQPIPIADGRATFHVLEALDPAAAILEYARMNRVSHIVMGARDRSFRKTFLGSVSQEVVSNAPCSVTVVRPPPTDAEVEETAEPVPSSPDG